MKNIYQDLDISNSFEPLSANLSQAFIKEAYQIERDIKIENHPFFNLAKENKNAMLLWTSQEAIVTNPFSQILFRLISNIKNVHIRSLLLPVAFGEHSLLKKGTAEKSHPWLIWRLCKSLEIKPENIKPTKAVIKFIKILEASVDNPMYGLGVLGIGNELMLLAEYSAIMKCFDRTFPEADYKSFLQANIGEDEVHSKLMGDAAEQMTTIGYNAGEFLRGAKDGVVARYKYYDDLLKEL